MRPPIFLVVGLVAAVLVGGVFGFRQVVLLGTKMSATKEFAKDRPVLNTILPPAPRRIQVHDDFTNATSLKIFGYILELPAELFTHDPKPHTRNTVLNHPRFRMLVALGLDLKTFAPLMQMLNTTNLYEFARSAFNAREAEIWKQRDMEALTRHRVLLNIKRMLTPAVGGNALVEFDRGDVKGFIIGDLANSKNIYIYVYIPRREEFITLGIMQKQKLQMPEIDELLSLLRVRIDSDPSNKDWAQAPSS